MCANGLRLPLRTLRACVDSWVMENRRHRAIVIFLLSLQRKNEKRTDFFQYWHFYLSRVCLCECVCGAMAQLLSLHIDTVPDLDFLRCTPRFIRHLIQLVEWNWNISSISFAKHSLIIHEIVFKSKTNTKARKHRAKWKKAVEKRNRRHRSRTHRQMKSTV